MSNNQRVLNITRGFTLKHKQALRAIENCSAAWVEYGISIRALSLAESIAARNQQSKQVEPLPLSELPGLSFQPPPRAMQSTQQEYRLATEANQYIQRLIALAKQNDQRIKIQIKPDIRQVTA